MGYAEPVKGKNTVLWVILGLAGFCILLCVLGSFFGYRFFQGVAGKAVNMVACGVDIEAARASLRKYAAENGGKLPPAGTWQDAAAKYFKAERDKMEESDIEEAKGIGLDVKLSDPKGVWGCHLDGGKIQAFVFNEELGGKKLDEIKNGSETVLLWEGSETGRNLKGRYALKKPTPDMAIMGEKREYMKIFVEGEFRLGSSSSRRRAKVEIGQ